MLLRRLLLVAATLAVAGFALVAFGDRSAEAPPDDGYGWSANEPDWYMGELEAGSSSGAQVGYAVDTSTVLGVGLLGVAALLTTGLVGYGLAVSRRSSNEGDQIT